MKHHKNTMKAEVRDAVMLAFNKYRINGHVNHDAAIDDVCEALQALKKSNAGRGYRLITKSEFLESIRRHNRHMQKNIILRLFESASRR